MTAQDIISSGLLELYTMGMASPEEIQQVEAAARLYPEVAAEISAIQGAVENYALAHAVAPDNAVKEKLMNRIGGNETVAAPAPVVKMYPASNTWKYAAAASIILLVGSVVLNFSLYKNIILPAKSWHLFAPSYSSRKNWPAPCTTIWASCRIKMPCRYR